MGNRLADALMQNLNGEFDDHLELSPQLAAALDAEAVEVEDALDRSNPRTVE